MSTVDTWGLALGLFAIILWLYWILKDDNDDGRSA